MTHRPKIRENSHLTACCSSQAFTTRRQFRRWPFVAKQAPRINSDATVSHSTTSSPTSASEHRRCRFDSLFRAARIREGYNPRAYVRKGCVLLRDWLEHLRGESQAVIGELYWRLRLNVALCEELDVPIYSFPMKYHPIKDPKYFSNRDFLGEHWCRKYIRFVQLVLNSTMGKVGRGKTFFFKAFGESTVDFREMLLMPEYMIRFRLDCEAAGVTARWKDALHKLSKEDEKQFRERLM